MTLIRRSYYQVQHRRHGMTGDWVGSDLVHMLFGDMSYQDKIGKRGNRYKALLDPQGECWQTTGHHDFLKQDDAQAALLAVAVERQGQPFRLVRIIEMKATKPLLMINTEVPVPQGEWCPVCGTEHVEPGEKTDRGRLTRQCGRIPMDDPRNDFANYPGR